MRFTITCAWLVAFLLPLVAATPLPAPNPEALGLAEPDANPGPNPDVTRINLAARATPTAGPHKGIATFYNTNISGNRVACGGTYNWNRPVSIMTILKHTTDIISRLWPSPGPSSTRGVPLPLVTPTTRRSVANTSRSLVSNESNTPPAPAHEHTAM